MYLCGAQELQRMTTGSHLKLSHMRVFICILKSVQTWHMQSKKKKKKAAAAAAMVGR